MEAGTARRALPPGKNGSADETAEPSLEGCNNGQIAHRQTIETHFHIRSASPLPRLTRCAGSVSLDCSIHDAAEKIKHFSQTVNSLHLN